MQRSGLALVLGMGGFGVQLGELLAADGPFDKIVFLDDAAPGAYAPLEGYADQSLLSQTKAAFVALGNNALREQWLQKLAKAGYCTPVFVHSKALVSPTATLGDGTLVLPFAYVGAGVCIGRAGLINAGAIVDHNARLGNGVHVAPGAIVKAGAVAEDYVKIESGQVLPAQRR